jgi:hypothetical protein
MHILYVLDKEDLFPAPRPLALRNMGVEDVKVLLRVQDYLIFVLMVDVVGIWLGCVVLKHRLLQILVKHLVVILTSMVVNQYHLAVVAALVKWLQLGLEPRSGVDFL